MSNIINRVSWNYINGSIVANERDAIKRLKEVCRGSKASTTSNEKFVIYISFVNPQNNTIGSSYEEPNSIGEEKHEINLSDIPGICNAQTIPQNFIPTNGNRRNHIFLIIKELFRKRNGVLRPPRSVKFNENPNIPVFFEYMRKGGRRKTSRRKKTTRKNKSRRYSSRSTSSS
jgi:hypothetical protein